VHSFYGDSHVLQGVSFSVKAGQLLALLGRNGAGKSTCISTIVGFLPPRRGAIRLFGQSIARLKPETICRHGMAFVPQGRRVFASLTVRENLDVARRASPGASGPWTFDRVYNLFPRLRGRQKQLAGSLSGGEQQMLAIGRALMGNPKVLLFDEPSEGLAPLIVAEGRPSAGAVAERGSLDSPGRAEQQARAGARRRSGDSDDRALCLPGPPPTKFAPTRRCWRRILASL
jgi:branched-chain amino acid transport system ATP-binding protein